MKIAGKDTDEGHVISIPMDAPFTKKKRYDDRDELLSTVWSVLTKEERIYDRIDEIVDWLVLYIMTKDEATMANSDKRKYHYIARRKLWDYMGHNGEDIKAKAREHRLWTNGKKW